MPKPRRSILPALLLLALATPAAAEEPTKAQADALCARYADSDPPDADQPTPAQAQGLADCDAEALLYGIGRSADPVRARLCAFVQAESPPDGPVQLFSGESLLMTIYANGWGVARNPAVAINIACQLNGAEMERTYRVPHLAGTLHEPHYKPIFSPCDDATSGFAGGECAAHDDRARDVAFKQAVDAYAAALPSRAEPAFDTLRKAQAAWADARSAGEIDLTGTARDAFEIEEERLQDEDFRAMLVRLAHGTPPALGAADRDRAQKRIDAVLPSLLSTPRKDDDITADGIRAAQAAWVAYRDAWGRFAAIRYPRWGAVGAEAWVSLKRADMLEHLRAQLR